MGRKEILDKMHRYFGADCGSQHVFVLHGLGGSGKSQLAFKFVQESTQYGSTIYEILIGDNLHI
jgi:adenylylsulfate kinase-like enzyme